MLKEMRKQRRREARRAPPKREPKKSRRLHVGEEVWRYRITRAGINIWPPGRHLIHIPMVVFSGWTWDELERADWKRYLPEIKPSDVKVYIETHDMLGPDCPGSGFECEPPIVQDGFENSQFGARRKYRPDQLVCPRCGEDPLHPIGWKYPAHKRKLPL